MNDQRQILEHLVLLGLLDATQARGVLGLLNQGAALVETLIENGLVDEVDLARGLGGFHGLKVVDISRVRPRREALDKAHGTFSRRHRLLPFAHDRQTGDLLVAVADPSAARTVLDTFRAKTGQKVRPYVAPYRSLLRAIEDHYFERRGATESASFGGQRHSQMGRSREVSTMGAVPGFGESGLGSRAPSPSLSQLASAPPAVEAAKPSSVDQFFEDHASTKMAGAGQKTELGAAALESFGAGVASDDVVERVRQENAELREHVHRLEVSLQLEINLVRQLAEMLLESGVIDRETYTAKMGRLR